MVKHVLLAIPVICIAAILIGLMAVAMKLGCLGAKLGIGINRDRN